MIKTEHLKLINDILDVMAVNAARKGVVIPDDEMVNRAVFLMGRYGLYGERIVQAVKLLVETENLYAAIRSIGS